MINGGHVMLYSKDADADRAFFRDVLKISHVDAGHGWLIFKLPPTEFGVHPSTENNLFEFYLMTDDIEAEMTRLLKAGVKCSPTQTQGWGVSTRVPLPGGGVIGMYQPRHARP